MNSTIYHDFQYFELVNKILNTGIEKDDRTGTGTYSIFGHQMRFTLENNVIPLLTSKKMHTKSIIYEILWYLQGSTNIGYLNENGVTIWDEWADDRGELGPVYGYQWRKWPTITGTRIEMVDGIKTISPVTKHVDQIATVIDTLKRNPNDRRMIVSAWNVGQLQSMALPPCHLLFQFWVGNGKLSCQLYQRSCDVGLGVPFNIVQYSILTRMIAHVTGLEPGEFIWTGGDVHIYKNHMSQLTEQVTRDPYPSPQLELNPNVNNIDAFQYNDFKIINYNSHPRIKMEVSI